MNPSFCDEPNEDLSQSFDSEDSDLSSTMSQISGMSDSASGRDTAVGLAQNPDKNSIRRSREKLNPSKTFSHKQGSRSALNREYRAGDTQAGVSSVDRRDVNIVCTCNLIACLFLS